jgi:hypothetical protein
VVTPAELARDRGLTLIVANGRPHTAERAVAVLGDAMAALYPSEPAEN